MPQKINTTLNFLVILLSSGLYLGYFSFIPGTLGTCLGVIIYIFLMPKSPYLYIISMLFLIILGIWISNKAEIIYTKKDDRRIVIDEVIGYLVSMYMLPYKFWTVVSAFLIFRFFDWIKPYPANKLAKLKGGIGVVADDIIVGVYTCLFLNFVILICKL